MDYFRSAMMHLDNALKAHAISSDMPHLTRPPFLSTPVDSYGQIVKFATP